MTTSQLQRAGRSWGFTVLPQLRAQYDLAYTNVGVWRHGKTAGQLFQIDRSLMLDLDHFGISAHVKREVCLKRPTKARMIQAHRNPATAYREADRYKALSYALIGVQGTTVQVGGCRVTAYPAIGMLPMEIADVVHGWAGRGLLYESDGSNWDANVQAAHMEFKMSVYSRLDPVLAAHARRWVGNFHGLARSADGTPVRYKGRDTVKSGAQDTSSGNTLLRIDLFVRACQVAGLPWVEVLAMGDDLLALIPEGFSVEQLIAAEATVGVVAKAAIFSDPCCATFLSATFAPSVAGYNFIPCPGRLLAKLFWTVHPILPKHRDAYRTAVAEPFLRVFRGNDFMETWLRHHIHPQAKGRKACPKEYLHKKALSLWAGETGTSPVDWHAFWARRYSDTLPPRQEVEQVKSLDVNKVWILGEMTIHDVVVNDIADPWERVGHDRGGKQNLPHARYIPC